MRHRILSVLFQTALCFAVLPAQTGLDRLDESWKRSLGRIDASWVSALKKMAWVSNDLKAGSNAYSRPKPFELPKVSESSAVFAASPLFTSLAVASSAARASTPSPTPAAPGTRRVKVVLGGDKFELPYADALEKLEEPARNAEAIAEHWGRMAATPHEDTITWLRMYQEKFLRNDWILHDLVAGFCRKIYPDRPGVAKLYEWFLATKLGYRTRLAYNAAGFYLVYACEDQIYGFSYFTFGGKKFYQLEKGRTGSVFTYPDDYPNAEKRMEFALKTLPAIPSPASERVLKFQYKRQDYEIPVRFEPSIPVYFTNYPQTLISYYGEAPLSPTARKSLEEGIRPHLEGKSDEEIVNFLLALTQKSFAYKTDGDQFGREKWFFAEETLFYPFSDCEDRSVFFVQMVRLHTKLPVVFIEYPGHMAAAVKFPTPPAGDRFTYGGDVYTICDPTYIGAPLGKAMPQFKDVAPKVFAVR